MIDRLLFLSDEYRTTLRDMINEDEIYENAAKKINDSYTLVVQKEEENGVPTDIIVGYRIEEGKMVDVWEGEQNTPFVMAAPYGIWVDIVKGRLNATNAFVKRKLKVKGNLAKILTSGKATDRLIALLQGIPTEFEGNYKGESFP